MMMMKIKRKKRENTNYNIKKIYINKNTQRQNK